ncbi:hypothetical protein ACFIOY_39010 [Bradyrhizobium sp. TZ2]
MFRLKRFCLSYERTNFRCCRFVLRRCDAQFNLGQGSRGVVEFAICVSDDFSQRELRRFSPLLSPPQTFGRTLAHCLSASFHLSRVIFDAAENFGGLVH